MPAPQPARRQRTNRGRHRAQPRRTAGGALARALRPGLAAVSRPGAMVLVATAFVAGAVTEVTWHQIDTDAARATQQAAAQRLAVRIARSDDAEAARLTAAATGYQAWRRTVALDLAAGAVLTAGDVSAAASGLVGPEGVAPLESALAELTELLDATPTATEALMAAPAPLPEPAPAPTVEAQVLPLTPGGDALELIAADGSDAADPVAGARTAAAAGAVGGRAAATGDVTGTGDAETSGPATAARTATPADGPTAAPTAPPTATPTGGSTATPTGGPTTNPTGGPTAAGEVAVGPERRTDHASRAAVREAVGPATPVADLDLMSTAELEVVAQRVIDLTAQVQAAADAVVAAQQAQAAAEEAARQAAAALAAKVARVEDAPNGAVPRDALCGVAFADDVLLRCDAAAALERLNDAYRADTGRSLGITSSYRSAAEQSSLYAAKPGLAAPAGSSNHGEAVAVDVADAGGVGNFSSPVYRWLVGHAGEFGWYHPSYMDPGGAGPLEPWHWEFGTPE